MDRQRSKQPAKSRPPKEGPKRTRSAHQKRVQGKNRRGSENVENDGRPAGNLGSKGQNQRVTRRGTGRDPGDTGDERGPHGGSGGGRGNRQNRAVNRS
jgi:hypothetical protein